MRKKSTWRAWRMASWGAKIVRYTSCSTVMASQHDRVGKGVGELGKCFRNNCVLNLIGPKIKFDPYKFII